MGKGCQEVGLGGGVRDGGGMQGLGKRGRFGQLVGDAHGSVPLTAPLS